MNRLQKRELDRKKLSQFNNLVESLNQLENTNKQYQFQVMLLNNRLESLGLKMEEVLSEEFNKYQETLNKEKDGE